MPAPPRSPASFREILELVWWRLDRALDEETIYWSALAGALDAARAGTTCLFDHHASPSHIGGSLQILREAIEKVGLRAVLCYEVTDRGDRRQRDQGLEENSSFLEWTRRNTSQGEEGPGPGPAALFRGMVGAHASFTLSDDALRGCAEVMCQYGAGLHIHVAEDSCDAEETRAACGQTLVERLARLGAMDGRTIFAHAIHLEDDEIDRAREAGIWFAHNPRSNMNNQVGYARVEKFGARLLLGTDGIGGDMFEEARFAFFKGRDGRAGLGAEAWTRALAANQRLASEAFGVDLDSLAPGSAADLIVLDYPAPTPVTAENLAWHLAFGMTASSVESVMVNGRFIVRERRFPLDAGGLYDQARRASRKLWARMQTL